MKAKRITQNILTSIAALVATHASGLAVPTAPVSCAGICVADDLIGTYSLSRQIGDSECAGTMTIHKETLQDGLVLKIGHQNHPKSKIRYVPYGLDRTVELVRSNQDCVYGQCEFTQSSYAESQEDSLILIASLYPVNRTTVLEGWFEYPIHYLTQLKPALDGSVRATQRRTTGRMSLGLGANDLVSDCIYDRLSR